MVTQLIKNERIETTVQKAKELRRVADQVVTLGKQVRPGSADPAGWRGCWGCPGESAKGGDVWWSKCTH